MSQIPTRQEINNKPAKYINEIYPKDFIDCFFYLRYHTDKKLTGKFDKEFLHTFMSIQLYLKEVHNIDIASDFDVKSYLEQSGE